MTSNYCQKHKKRLTQKVSNYLKKKKKTKVEKRLMHKDLSEGQMQKLVEYRRNYYLTHNK